MSTEFKVVGREYDGALNLLADSFPRRLINIVIQEAGIVYGPENTLIPTNVHFMPVYFEGESTFSVRAWHETESPEGKVGILQPYLGNFDVIIGDEDGYLHSLQEDEKGIHYKITTAEAIGLLSLARVAAHHDAIAYYADQEAS